MNALWITIIVVGLLALAFLVDRLFLNRRVPVKSRENFSMADAWTRYFGHLPKGDSRDGAAVELLKKQPEALETVQSELSELEENLSREPLPLRSYRMAIMDATDQFLFSETLSPGELSLESAQAAVKAGVLRCYTRHRHGDYAPRDWYSHYCKMASMHARNVVGMIEKTTSGGSAQLESTLHDHLMSRIEDTRKHLLEFPVAQAVEREHEDKMRQESSANRPTQKQMDGLASLMRDRFDDLFSGRVYSWLDGPSVNPAGALALDSGILFTLLSRQYPESREIWGEVLCTALGTKWGQVADFNELQKSAEHYQQLWNANESEGPLSAVLKEAATEVFLGSGGSNGSGQDTQALQMSSDGMVLVREIQAILRDKG